MAVAELGDKTQLVTIMLAAENPPVLVLVGLTLGFAVLIGAKLLTRLPMKYLKIGTSVLFMVLGGVS